MEEGTRNMLFVDKNYTAFCRAYRFSCMFRIRERDGRIKVELIIKMRLFDYRTTASLFLMLLFYSHDFVYDRNFKTILQQHQNKLNAVVGGVMCIHVLISILASIKSVHY